MPITTANIYREMDEKYGDKMETLFGAGLMTWPEDVDSSRMYMFTSNLKQILTLLEPDVPHVMTGYENAVGEHNKAYKMMKGNWQVKDIIWKYGPGTIYTMILYNPDTDTFDVIEKKPAENLTEKFGYAYNTSFMDSLKPGDRFRDKVLYKTTSYDDNMNYCPGKNARVMYITDNSTIEDSIVISKSWADKVRTVEVDSVEVSINTNDILLNMYGDRNFYKCFPDVGEHVSDSIVCGVRRINHDHILYDFKEENLRIPQSTDILRYTSKNALIYDIDVYYNGEEEFPDNTFYRQLKQYYDMECEYSKKVTDWCKKIKNSGSKYTQDVAYHKARWQLYADSTYKWKNRDSAFSNIVVKFSTLSVVSLQEGFKLTGRYGDKGIISRISDSGYAAETLFNNTINSILDIEKDSDLSPEQREKLASHITLVDDCDMPYLEDGTKVDILLNSSGAIRRLNSGQLVEVEINFVAENIQRKLKTMTNQDEKAELIFKFLGLLNKDQQNFFLTIYKGYDQTIQIGEDTVRMLDQRAKDAFFEDIETNGFYIVKRPDAKIRYDAMVALYEEFPWIKPYTAYIDRFGIKKRKIIHPIICASKYMLVLKQTSNKNFSARSTGRIDKKGLPAKSSEKKQNLSAYSKTPIRIGETHNLYSGIDSNTIAEFNIFTRSSPLGRKSLKRILEAKGDPFDIKKLKIKDDFTNQNAVILNAYMKGIGLHLEYDIDGVNDYLYEDVPTEYIINGYLIYDIISRKPLYQNLLNMFRSKMEDFDVIETYIGEKEESVWKWVFEEMQIDGNPVPGDIQETLLFITKPDIPSDYSKNDVNNSSRDFSKHDYTNEEEDNDDKRDPDDILEDEGYEDDSSEELDEE